MQCDKHTLDVVDSIHYCYEISLLLYVYILEIYEHDVMFDCYDLIHDFMMSLHSSIYQLIVCDIMA